MVFDLTHPKNVQKFKTKEEADALCPSDTGSITYRSVYSNWGKCWIIQRRHVDSITGYLEKENA